MTRLTWLSGAALAALCLAPSAALADGPCTNDIAQLGRQLGGQVGLGAPVSEPGAGQQVEKNVTSGQTNTAGGTSGTSATDRSQPGGASRTSGGSPGTVGGVAGPVGAGAGNGTASGVASGAIATSPEDVRRQSEGKPTTAVAAAKPGGATDTASSDKVSQAKMALQRAVDLNAKGDKACMDAIRDARNLMPH